MKIKSIILSVLFLLFTGLVYAQDNFLPPTDAQFKQIINDFDNFTEKTRQDFKIPGMAIGIVKDGTIIFAKGYGVKTQGSNDKVDENTLFQIGSTSKAFTATLTAMLVDEKKIKWDDRVIDHDQDFMMYDPWVTREFQIYDLMSQHSGLPAYSADTLFFLGFDREYIRNAIRYIKPVTSFRSKFAYQNGLWLYVSKIIEKYYGKKWEQLVNEKIFKPLNMTDSSCDMESFINSKNSSSYHYSEKGKIIALEKNWKFGYWSYTAGPAGGINSNIEDMSKWLIFQMNEGKIGEKQIVSKESFQAIHTPKTNILFSSEQDKNIYYCMGWMYQEHKPYPIIWHNGGTLMKTMLAYIPEQKIGIVILSNYVTDLPEQLASRFFKAYSLLSVKDIDNNIQKELDEIKKDELNAEKTLKPEEILNPMDDDKYTGEFYNAIYGKITIKNINGKLNIDIGPNKVNILLKHFNGNVFTAKWPFYDESDGQSYAILTQNPDGTILNVRLTNIDQDNDMGLFNK